MRVDRCSGLGKWAVMLAALALVAGLSACGRKGPLEPPPGSVVEPAQGEEQPAETNNDTPFILDPLI